MDSTMVREEQIAKASRWLTIASHVKFRAWMRRKAPLVRTMIRDCCLYAGLTRKAQFLFRGACLPCGNFIPCAAFLRST